MNAVSIHSQASLVVEPLVIPRAVWRRQNTTRGVGFKPIKGTWHAVVEKRGFNTSAVLPLLCCPGCSGLLVLVHNEDAAAILTKMTGARGPVTHIVDHLGLVKVRRAGVETPGDVACSHDGCSFHRKVYLDQWNRLRPLYCTAYTQGSSPKVEFAYSHAASRKEARFHLGVGQFNVIAVGRAVGMLFDEKNKTFQAEVTSR